MYPRPALYVVLLSPSIVLMIMSAVVSFDRWLSDGWVTFFIILLMCAVAVAEFVRVYLRGSNSRD